MEDIRGPGNVASIDWHDTPLRDARSAADISGMDTLRPPRPVDFRVELSADKQHLDCIVVDRIATRFHQYVDGYRIYFAPRSYLVNANDINDARKAMEVFSAAEQVGDLGAGNRGDELRFEADRRFVGKAGWFWAVTLSFTGIESLPTPPFEAPTGDGVGDSAVPADVIGAMATLVPEYVDGRAVVKVVVTAQIPNPIGSFAGYQIYLRNYRNVDKIVEIESFRMNGTEDPGDPLSGSFPLRPDIGVPYQVGTIDVATGSATIQGHGTDWATSWKGERNIAFYAGSTTPPESTTGKSKLYVNNSISSVTDADTLVVSAADTWTNAFDIPYAIWLSGQNEAAGLGEPHPVTLYFVALSRGGTRRPDIQNSPSVTFPFGIGAALSAPFQPVNLAVAQQSGSPQSSQGATVTLKWQMTVPGYVDARVEHFNIYKRRQGTQHNPLTPAAARPLGPYATVKVDRALGSGGFQTFVDRQWNTNPDTAATSGPDGWDFNPADFGEYVYWVNSVNVEGTENRASFWGTLDSTATSATVTYSGGDVFTDAFVGQSIDFGSGGPYTVTAHSGSTLTITPAAADTGTDVDYLIGPVTGRVRLMGTSGAETDATLHGDDFFNRIFNAAFISDCAAATDRPMATDHNIGYAAAHKTADGQPTFNYYFTDGEYQTGVVGSPAGINGKQNNQVAVAPPTTYGGGNPAVGVGPADDNWSVWQYLISGTGGIPAFVSGGGTATTGEVVINPAAHTTPADYSGIWQQVQRRKLQDGMKVTLTVYAKAESTGGAGGGVLFLQCTRFDARDFGNAAYQPATHVLGDERDSIGATFSLSTLKAPPLAGGSGYQRYSAIGNLPTSDPVILNVTAMNGFNVFTTAATDFNEEWMGCLATVTDGAYTYGPAEIQQFSGGGSTSTHTTITFDPAFTWGNPNTSAATLHVTITFTHYAFKVTVLGDFDRRVFLKMPMLNSGVLGAPWNPTMVIQDWPGGVAQTPGGGVTPGPGCVPGGTMVLTPDGYRPIELMIPGNKVLSVRGGRFIPSIVKKLNRVKTADLMRLQIGEHELWCSPTHRIKVEGRKYKEAQHLFLGDTVMVAESSTPSLAKVEAIELATDQQIMVYSLSVEPVHNYVAGNVICHNKPPVGDLDL